MAMKLRCHCDGIKCPPYKHEGVFQPRDDTVKKLLPDLERCADCMASVAPKLPAFREDLRQIAAITLLEKGAAYDPTHASGASFGAFIRPRICITLSNARRKELIHQGREHLQKTSPAFWGPDSAPCFVDELLSELTLANFQRVLPQLRETLTPREQQVFDLIREDMRNRKIAETLHLSPGRVSQLVTQVEIKLKTACQQLGIIEEASRRGAGMNRR